MGSSARKESLPIPTITPPLLSSYLSSNRYKEEEAERGLKKEEKMNPRLNSSKDPLTMSAALF
jgi:hypothetical protein